MKDFFSSGFKMFEDKDVGKWIPHVRRDWTISLCSTVAIVAVFAAFHVFFYVSMMSGNFFSAEDSSIVDAPNIVQQKNLDKVLTAFQKKKEDFDAIIANPIPFSDPSGSQSGVVPSQTITSSPLKNTPPSPSVGNIPSSLPQPSM